MDKTTPKLKFSELQEQLDTIYRNAVQESIAEHGDDWDGVLPDNWTDAINDIEESIAGKKNGMIRYIKESVNDIEFLEKQKTELDKRIKKIRNKATGMQMFLEVLQKGQPFECAEGVIGYKKKTNTVYSAEMQKKIKAGIVPKGFEEFAVTTTKTSVSVPKTDVKKAIDSGRKLDGAQVVTQFVMEIK